MWELPGGWTRQRVCLKTRCHQKRIRQWLWPLSLTQRRSGQHHLPQGTVGLRTRLLPAVLSVSPALCDPREEYILPFGEASSRCQGLRKRHRPLYLLYSCLVTCRFWSLKKWVFLWCELSQMKVHTFQWAGRDRSSDYITRHVYRLIVESFLINVFRPEARCPAWWCHPSSSSLLNWNFLDLCWGTQTVFSPVKSQAHAHESLCIFI